MLSGIASDSQSGSDLLEKYSPYLVHRSKNNDIINEFSGTKVVLFAPGSESNIVLH